ncbi:MAG: hypothetical protein JJV99_05970 [Colwellia sp.]|nr:hypothetical protein [Colwellia sp.]
MTRKRFSPLIYAETDQQAVSVITLAADSFLQKLLADLLTSGLKVERRSTRYPSPT